MRRFYLCCVLLLLCGSIQAETWRDAWEREQSQSYSKGLESGRRNSRFPEGVFLQPPGIMQKRVMGKPEFEKVRNLSTQDRDRKLATKIAHLEMEGSLCSGFLVGPDLLLTNHHCVYDKKAERSLRASSFKIYMKYLDDAEAYRGKGGLDSGVEKILAMDETLDYALLKLKKPLGKAYGWLKIDGRKQTLTGSVKVIQHPRGRAKEVARTESKIVAQHSNALHYLADTEGGSSGSPVFLKHGESVIALHHAGYAGKYNEGIPLSAILPHIDKWLPEHRLTEKPRIRKPDPWPRSNTVVECDPWKNPDCGTDFGADVSRADGDWDASDIGSDANQSGDVTDDTLNIIRDMFQTSDP